MKLFSVVVALCADALAVTRTRVATALASGLILSTLLVWVPSPAGAALTNVWPADGYGEIYPDFTTDDALFVYVTSDTRGGRVCVIPGDTEGDCENPSWGEANVILGVGTVYSLIEGPDLVVGNWRLRTESPQPDGWVKQATSDVFTVAPCEVDCALQIGKRQAEDFKGASADATRFARVSCTAFAVKKAADDAAGARKVVTGGFEAAGTRTLPGVGWAASVAGLAGLSFDIPSYNDQAKKILQMMSCQVAKMHEDIAKDPPDPAIQLVQPPVFHDPPNTGSAAVDILADALDRQAAHGIAARIAYERYQGAVAAGDLAAQRLQAAAAADQAFALARELRATADAARAAAAAAPGHAILGGPIVGTSEELAALAAIADRVKTQGFTPEEVARLRELGADDAGIAAARTWFDLDLSGITPGRTLADLLVEVVRGYDAAVAGTDAFARAAAAVSTTDLAPPTVSIQGQPLTRDTWRFTATASSPDGDPVSISWDFGDGTTAVGAVVEHRFTTSGQFTVRATVTETSPWGSTTTAAYPHVSVVRNSPPSPRDDVLEVAAGATSTVNVLANDADNDGDRMTVTSITPAEAGRVACQPDGDCTYTADAGLVGTETLFYEVTDGKETARGKLQVTIVAANPPTAGDLSVTIPRGSAVIVALPATDPEPGPQPLVGEVVRAPGVVGVEPWYPTSFRIKVPNDAVAGTDTFTYRVSDGAQVSAPATITVRIVEENRPPVAADVSVTTPAGVPVELTLAGSDPEGTPLQYSYSYPTIGSLSGTAPRLVYDPGAAAPGTVVSFGYQVNDGSMHSEPATVSITIGPRPGGPVVDLGPDLDVREGVIYFDALARDPDGGTITYLWDFGDGRTSTLSSPQLVFDDGVYNVTLTVTDSQGRAASDAVRMTVRNQPPTVYGISVTAPALAGMAMTFSASASDPGEDSLTYRWDFGDGTTLETDAVSVQHVFARGGTNRVTLVVTDDDGALGSSAVDLTVRELAADAGPDQAVPEGSAVTLAGTGFPELGSGASWAWDLGDGTKVQSVSTVTHEWSGDEPRTATLTVTYGDLTITDEVAIRFTNVAPSLGPAAALEVEAGVPSRMLAGAFDPGDDPMTVRWDFGDGTSAQGEMVEHTWATPGSYPVQILARDDEGATAEAMVTVTVVAAGIFPAPTIDSRGRAFHMAFDRNVTREGAEQYLLITGEGDTTGTVSVPGLGFRASFAIAAGRISTVRLPDRVVPPAHTGNPAVEIHPHAVVVHARKEVSVYGVNREQFTTDAFLALPDDIAGTNYRAVGYGYTAGQIDVVALEPDTQVTVGGVEGHAVPPATLQPGQVLRVPAMALNTEVMGVPIVADRPVQVLSGSLCTNVQASFCDHLVEAVWPTAMWGERFLTVPLATRKGDTVRVLADRDGTEVRMAGEVVATLGAGRWHEAILYEATEITTSEPAMVVQYSNGTGFDNVLGDPFQMLVPPFEQWLDRYTVATLPGIRANFLNVVIQAGAQGTLVVDGAPVDPAAFKSIGSSGYVGAQLPVGAGEHRLVAARPFALFAYGFDDFDSYGYPAGLALGRVAEVAALALSPAAGVRDVGSRDCPVATVTDAAGAGLPGIRVDLQVAGANETELFGSTGEDGSVPLCFTGTSVGEDELVAQVGGTTAAASRTWVQAAAPPLNRAPTVTDVEASTAAGTPVAVGLQGSDPDGDAITLSVVDGPAHGTLGPVTGATVTYTPASGFTGTDSFTFAASDGTATSAPATARLTVLPAAVVEPPAKPTSVELAPPSARRDVGTTDCTRIIVRDANAVVMVGAGVAVVRTGVNPGQEQLVTGTSGFAEHCYAGKTAGEDVIAAAAGRARGEATRTWVAVPTPTPTPDPMPAAVAPASATTPQVAAGGASRAPLAGAAASPRGGLLPVTGAEILAQAVVGAGLVATGLVMSIGISRRRRGE